MAVNHHGIFFSVEMKERQILYKMISMESGFELSKLRNKKIFDHEYNFLNEKIFDLHNINLKITNKYQDISSILAMINRLYYGSKLDFVVIDYLQLVKARDIKVQRYQQVGDMSRSLKLKTIELDIPIIVLAQLSRNADERAPQLSDLRESGDLEQDADNVMFLWNDKEIDSSNININFAKQRLGPTGIFQMRFDKPINLFSDIYHDKSFESKQVYGGI